MKIELHDGNYAFAQVLEHPLYAFFDLSVSAPPPIDEIIQSKIIFTIMVMDYAITKGIWDVIGTGDLATTEPPSFFRQDSISKKLYRSQVGKDEDEEINFDEASKLECAAVWDPEHVVDRLNDHFANIPNKWYESMRPVV